MHLHTVHAVIAVKHLDRAKTRLAAVLPGGLRAELVLAMLADTVAAATATPGLASVTVVTPDARAAQRVRRLGAEVLPEPETAGLNAALDAAATALRRRHGPCALLALQADLPAVQPAELSALLAATGAGARTVVADHTGTGTAALLVRDPRAALRPRFGPDSARRHREDGALPLIGSWPGLRHDVDTPSDLNSVTSLGPGPATTAVLATMSV